MWARMSTLLHHSAPHCSILDLGQNYAGSILQRARGTPNTDSASCKGSGVWTVICAGGRSRRTSGNEWTDQERLEKGGP